MNHHGTTSRAPSPKDNAAELDDLRRRLEGLERRLNASWILHSNFLVRGLGVLWYWLIGYGLIAAIGFAVALAVIAILRLATGDWP
jgi:hypothetical protein